MPKITFTKKKIDSIKFTDGGQALYWDTETPGFGLVVGTKTKTFRLQIDVKDPSKKGGYRTIKKTLGRYGAEITLEQAKNMVKGYVDQEGNAVLGERIKIKLGDTSSNAGADVTLQELMKSYFRETKRRDGKERRESSAKQYQDLIERHYAGWMPLSLKEVNSLAPDVVMDKFQQVSVAGAMAARNSAVMLSAVLNYGLAKYPATLKSNPMAVLTSRHVNVMEKIKARHECLIFDAEKKRNDFSVFFKALQKLTEIRRDLLLFTLYTGMRHNESATLQWENIDLEHRELLIKDTKNRENLHIPLNRQAMTILERRKAQMPEGCKWVFPAIISSNKSGHASMRSDHLKRTTGLDLTIHALRRTFITIGRKLKRYEDTDLLTNHIDGSVTGQHYDETDIEDLRETTQMIGNEIERRMLDVVGAKVIQLNTAQAA
ncbi:tyrosine-type recombinase/integrase [Oryzomonas sagensis]|uniref:Tyrosine-type recombinase/integrase n=1 Tax=Oryzomonas sagensis TaxID=2603857 RepID=A0ABQ6TM69_9BACT|nr:tyrosine-type recombinase/integrase [Oryzomonas sagensis]KAB0669293.1 tyrosine-type recombinase/integrase [Oryzomonas sagensis]